MRPSTSNEQRTRFFHTSARQHSPKDSAQHRGIRCFVELLHHLGVSENRLNPHCTQWFSWWLSLWTMAISLGRLTQHFQLPTHLDLDKLIAARCGAFSVTAKLRTPTSHTQYPALATQRWPGHPYWGRFPGSKRFPGAGEKLQSCC